MEFGWEVFGLGFFGGGGGTIKVGKSSKKKKGGEKNKNVALYQVKILLERNN